MRALKRDTVGRRHAVVAITLAVGAVVLACGPMPEPTTTTKTTTTTSSTSSSTTTTLSPLECSTYTPTSVGVTPPNTNPGASITVSGTGTAGTTVKITFKKGATIVDNNTTTTVAPGGTFSVGITLPPSVGVGLWDVRANLVGCATFATTLMQVDP